MRRRRTGKTLTFSLRAKQGSRGRGKKDKLNTKQVPLNLRRNKGVNLGLKSERAAGDHEMQEQGSTK